MVKIHVPVMEVVKSPRIKMTWPRRVARFIGRAAWYVHRVIVNRAFKLLFILAVAYGAMKLAQITIEISRAGEVIVKIK